MDEHRQRMVGMYCQFINPGDLCFDVGANMGNRVEAFLALGARVIAVEPQQQCADYLYAKYGRNKCVTVEPVGLADSPGEHEFLVSTNSAVSSMSKEWIEDLRKRGDKFAHYGWAQTIIVPVTTLDNLIQRYGLPAFCKIDVEGFEYQVLRGLSQPIQTLSLEYTPEHVQPARDCVKWLAALGNYEFNYSVGETMTFALNHWVKADELNNILDQLRAEKASGDVYARLIRPHLPT